VVGDLIKIERGMMIPADCVLTGLEEGYDYIAVTQRLLNGAFEEDLKVVPLKKDHRD
jgi:hypothetical protein